LPGTELPAHRVRLYDAGCGREADLAAIASYLSSVRGIEAVAAGTVAAACAPEVAGERSRGGEGQALPPRRARTARDLAEALARARVHDLTRRDSFEDPLPAEVRFLERRITGASAAAFGNLYDGMAAMSAFRSVLGTAGELAIVLWDQILCTWDEGDLRYHARVLVAGSPALVSIPGVVVAPARPREYYLYRQAAAAGTSDAEIESKMRELLGDRYVTHGDSRIPEIVKGYCLQAVAYWFFGEAFCDDPRCRLFNAHWQEEMLRAQLGGPPRLCRRHAAMLGVED